jgi:hypothetical protein
LHYPPPPPPFTPTHPPTPIHTFTPTLTPTHLVRPLTGLSLLVCGAPHCCGQRIGSVTQVQVCGVFLGPSYAVPSQWLRAARTFAMAGKSDCLIILSDTSSSYSDVNSLDVGCRMSFSHNSCHFHKLAHYDMSVMNVCITVATYYLLVAN